MSTNAIAKRYAKALVQIASEDGTVTQFNSELVAFNALLSGNPELAALFANPAYDVEAKRKILREIIGKLSLSETVANFLQLLLDKNRLSVLPQIAASFGSFADELSGVIRPTLTSGMPLEVSQVEAIRGSLTKSTGKNVVLSVEVDPALIGGVVTKIGNTVYDGSVKTQLSRIEDILQKG